MTADDWRDLYEQDERFLPIPRCLIQSGKITISAAIVYAVLADYDIDGDNIAEMQQADIMQITGLSRSTVQRSLDELIALDLIEPEPERTGRGNVYHITVRLLPPIPQSRIRAAHCSGDKFRITAVMRKKQSGGRR